VRWKWESKDEVWIDIFVVVFVGLLSPLRLSISNNWIQAAIWTLTSVMLVLLVIWYIYLRVTPSLSEKVEKRMYYTFIILKVSYIILALLIAFDFFAWFFKNH
jgi:uncharacterized membrane protein YjfL (UPF0719 family)